MLWSASALLRPQAYNATSMSASRLADRRIDKSIPVQSAFTKQLIFLVKCLSVWHPTLDWWASYWNHRFGSREVFNIWCQTLRKILPKPKKEIFTRKKQTERWKRAYALLAIFFNSTEIAIKFPFKFSPELSPSLLIQVGETTVPKKHTTVQTALTRINWFNLYPFVAKSNRFFRNQQNVK